MRFCAQIASFVLQPSVIIGCLLASQNLECNGRIVISKNCNRRAFTKYCLLVLLT